MSDDKAYDCIGYGCNYLLMYEPLVGISGFIL